jgi:hypothetical protein
MPYGVTLIPATRDCPILIQTLTDAVNDPDRSPRRRALAAMQLTRRALADLMREVPAGDEFIDILVAHDEVNAAIVHFLRSDH